MAAAASGFSTSMVALKSLHCNTSSSCQFRIICKPIFPKRRFVRRGASIVNPRCEAVSSESAGDKGGDSSRASSSMSALEQLKASSADITLQDHDHVLQIFLKERYLDADFVSKASDLLWLNNYLQLITPSPPQTSPPPPQTPQQLHQVMDNDNGLLKLTKAYRWVLGDKVAPPINNKPLPKEFQNDSELRKRLNILKYDAIKREMMLLTIVVGTICSGFCLVALSVQVAISYAAGALLSCFYLQLLCYHVDNLSRESVPQVFMQKKSKKIGIRSEDVRNLLEKVVKGSAFALSSPRLMIPAAIYGFWGLSNHFSDNLLGFQLVPAMFGMFAYKAAALVQVYRDNEDLLIVFPESWEGSSN